MGRGTASAGELSLAVRQASSQSGRKIDTVPASRDSWTARFHVTRSAHALTVLSVVWPSSGIKPAKVGHKQRGTGDGGLVAFQRCWLLPIVHTLGLRPTRRLQAGLLCAIIPPVSPGLAQAQAMGQNGAQLCGSSAVVAHLPSKQTVAGSNPVSRSTSDDGPDHARSQCGPGPFQFWPHRSGNERSA